MGEELLQAEHKREHVQRPGLLADCAVCKRFSIERVTAETELRR